MSTIKPRGRPPTGAGTPVHIRCSEEFLEKLDAWREKEAAIVSRSEAIRRLVERGIAPSFDFAVTWVNPVTKQEETFDLQVKSATGKGGETADMVAAALLSNPILKVLRIEAKTIRPYTIEDLL